MPTSEDRHRTGRLPSAGESVESPGGSPVDRDGSPARRIAPGGGFESAGQAGKAGGSGSEAMDTLPVYCKGEILIAGCGNKLFGDDGFGPEVVDYLLSHYPIPDNICLLDVGTAIRKILFTVTLSEPRPRVIVIIDAVDKGREPGEIFEISLDEIPPEKIDDFSIHQVPSSNLLRELRDLCGVEVRVMACQVLMIPETIQSGLSEPVRKAVPLMARRIAESFFRS